jgi:hypothetical protein
MFLNLFKSEYFETNLKIVSNSNAITKVKEVLKCLPYLYEKNFLQSKYSIIIKF